MKIGKRCQTFLTTFLHFVLEKSCPGKCCLDTPISGLVPRISLSIEALLAKYDKLPTVKAVQEAHGQSDVDVNRITFGARSGKNFSRNNQSKKDGAKGDGSNSSRQFCPGCYYLGNHLLFFLLPNIFLLPKYNCFFSHPVFFSHINIIIPRNNVFFSHIFILQ